MEAAKNGDPKLYEKLKAEFEAAEAAKDALAKKKEEQAKYAEAVRLAKEKRDYIEHMAR